MKNITENVIEGESTASNDKEYKRVPVTEGQAYTQTSSSYSKVEYYSIHRKPDNKGKIVVNADKIKEIKLRERIKNNLGG